MSSLFVGADGAWSDHLMEVIFALCHDINLYILNVSRVLPEMRQ